MKKIAIIGAGLSGLSLANALKNRAEIALFEKQLVVSGRMASIFDADFSFDHGAQYFTARTPEFQDFIQPMLRDGRIQPWHARCATLKDNVISDLKDLCLDEPRYVGVPSMASIGQSISRGLDVRFNTQIKELNRTLNWQLIDQNNKTYSNFDWVICTLPASQNLEILPTNFYYFHNIQAVAMHGCFAVMLGFHQAIDLPFNAAHVVDADISWIAVNSSKPGRPENFSLVIHSSEAYSNTHKSADHEQILNDLISKTSDALGKDLSCTDFKKIDYWNFANNNSKARQPIQQPLIDPQLKLAACGDWCQGGRVEGAFVSGLQMSEALKAFI